MEEEILGNMIVSEVQMSFLGNSDKTLLFWSRMIAFEGKEFAAAKPGKFSQTQNKKLKSPFQK